MSDDTFAERLRKSISELGLSISDVAELCGITKSVICGYELNRYTPTKDVLDLLVNTFNIQYLCMDGYTKLVYNFDVFLDKVNIWIKENNYTRLQAAKTLGISASLFRFWYNGGTISINTYKKIASKLEIYELV